MSKEDFIELIHNEVNREFGGALYMLEIEDVGFLKMVDVTITIHSDFNSAYSIRQSIPYEVSKRNCVEAEIRPVLRRMHERADKYVNENSDWDLSLKQYL